MQKKANDSIKIDGDLMSVDVSVRNRIVILNGEVKSEGAKSKATILGRVEGVKEVYNNITVSELVQEVAKTEVQYEIGTTEHLPLLYDEAKEEAEKFLKEYVANCGELYYFRSNDDLWACKYEPEVEVEGKEFQVKELSEADRLNGVDPLPIEWKGNLKITMKLCRTLYLGPASTNAWSDWRDSDWHKPKAIIKSKGKWTITNESDYGQGGKIRKIPHKCLDGSQIEILDKAKK